MHGREGLTLACGACAGTCAAPEAITALGWGEWPLGRTGALKLAGTGEQDVRCNWSVCVTGAVGLRADLQGDFVRHAARTSMLYRDAASYSRKSIH